MKKTKCVLGQDLCNIMPFVHAIRGCDTTSRLFGVEKGQALKKATQNLHFKECANSFCRATSKKKKKKRESLVKAMVALYGGVPHEELHLLRFRKFTTKVMSSSIFIEVHTLPPTADSTMFHICRTFYQVKE